MEEKAYKLGLIWEELSKTIFPNYKHSRFPKKGDPKKSSLFKYCYKLVRETCGLLGEDEYYFYVKAQLDILKSIKIGEEMPLVSPQILVGDKAWIRWKIWKKKYNNVVNTVEKIGLAIYSVEEIKKELERTNLFLVGKFAGIPRKEQLLVKDIERWLNLGKLSPFFVMLSFLANLVKIDKDLYEKSITEEVREIFKEIFKNYENII